MQRIPDTARPIGGEYSTRLRQLRLQRGLSQEELAQIMRCSVPSVSRYERQMAHMNASHIVRLLRYFRCRFEELIN